ncbi:unnamed protein product [Protopolystoma xenopodis]|uniref:KIF-binding protein n=1 Tax=Protopolystoma xenopodis TaxID=117903 RepID=A0A448XIP0_9PLAT|nr:unnamed protein product [Protopolystoma xenopodis]
MVKLTDDADYDDSETSGNFRHSPSYLWRLARAAFLAGRDAVDTPEPASLDTGQPCASLGSLTSSSSSISSARASFSLDPNLSFSDGLIRITSRLDFIHIGLAVGRRALRLVTSAASTDNQASNEPLEASLIGQYEVAQTYLWLAVLVGLAATRGGLQKRIEYGHEFKTLIDKAVTLDPTNAWAYHLKGRWCYKVSCF